MSDTEAPPLDLGGIGRERERRIIREKSLVMEVVRAVLRTQPDHLPAPVRAAREKLEKECEQNPKMNP
jgi:hypothetical protein